MSNMTIVHLKLNEIMLKIGEHIGQGYYKYTLRENKLIIEEFDLALVEFIERAVKDAIEDRETFDRDPDPPRDRVSFPIDLKTRCCELCSHFEEHSNETGRCNQFDNATVYKPYCCSRFLRRVKPICQNCDHFDPINGAQGTCGLDEEVRTRVHTCKQFQYTVKDSDIEREAPARPPDRCSDCQHEFKRKPPTLEPLRLCPFCGSDAIEVTVKGGWVTVCCLNCHRPGCPYDTTGPFASTKKEAIKAWNLRAFETGDDS